MSTIKSMIQRVQAVRGREAIIIEDVFVKNEIKIADKQREQLFEGFDKNQQRLKRYRNDLYARRKNRMNPKPGFGNPDFKDKGDFYRGIEIRVDGGVIRTLLYDEKSEDLLERDPNIIGLGGPYKQELIDETLRPGIVGDLKSALKL
jgi:hypothetical protein